MSLLYIDSNTDKDLLIDFCNDSYSETRDSAVNYYVRDWENNPASLMYKIYVEKVYDSANRGAYIGMLMDDKIVCAAGINKYNVDDNVALYLTRGYTKQSYRGNTKILKHTMSYALLDKIVEYDYRAAMISFNEYNLKLRQSIYNINNLDNFPEHVRIDNKYYKHVNGTEILPMKMYDHPITLNYTKQYLLYLMIDESYENNFLSVLHNQRI